MSSYKSVVEKCVEKKKIVPKCPGTKSTWKMRRKKENGTERSGTKST